MILFSPRETRGDASQAKALAESLKVSPLVAELLCNRGYDTAEKAAGFLQPDCKDLHDPYLFPQMQDAVDCILAAGSMGLRICVFGDYDCDGICATAILTRFLQSMDFEVVPYIPVRSEEGYGLNMGAIDSLAELGVELLITVDCGISAAEEIAYAYEKGMEVIVTDHHQCPPILPECEAIIDPAMEDGYPFAALCGAGVVFKLVEAIGGLEAALPYVDIAAIATVADIVSLTDENRILVSEGLARLRGGDANLGMRALIEEAGLEREKLASSHIAFGLAPRINAAGRLGRAQDSLLLFLTEDEQEARSLARKLGKENEERQAIEREILEEAEAKIRAGEGNPARQQAILLAEESWNSGVIGIVASRLAKRYHRPVILFAGDGDSWTASGRSVEGVDLYQALSNYAEYFERFGGHAMAAGLTIKYDRYEEFKEKFLAYAQEISPECLLPKAHYDMQIRPQDANDRLVRELSCLAPFGTGNPSPVFYIPNLRAESPRTMGQDGKHLRFQVKGTDCVAFGCGQDAAVFADEDLDLLVELEHNTFAGKTRLQIRVKEWRSRMPADISGYVREREDRFYTSLLYRSANGMAMAGCFEPVLQSKGILLMDREDIKKELFAALHRGIQGTAILVFSPGGAEELLTALAAEGLLERVNLRWGDCHDPVAYNCVVCAPDLTKCDFGDMERVFCWDGPYDEAAVEMLGGLSAQVFYGHGDEGAWLKDMQVPREKMIPLYKAMLFLARKQQRFPDMDAYEAALQGLVVADPYAIRLALLVFSELEFLRVEEGNPFLVAANENPAQRDLEQSNVYVAVSGLQNNYANRAKQQ